MGWQVIFAAMQTASPEPARDARQVIVIGAGTMGGGIAAHLANVGFRVSLLDVSTAAVEAGFERTRAAKPPHFYLPDRASDVRLGNLHDHLDWVAEADWVCEAITENLALKRELFDRIAPLLRPDAFVSTNTSGLQIALLAQGLPEHFRRRFLGTHFFNPPRYLKLLELIPTAETDPAVVGAMTAFLEGKVGRRVVLAKDTPGFIANRFGMWAMVHAIHTAERLHLSVEQVDAITGPFLGRPRSASFRLNDIVGLDVMHAIAQNLTERCAHDPHVEVLRTPASLAALLERGWIGEKVQRGYYRREAKELLSLDLGTLAYRERREPELRVLSELGKRPLGERVRTALESRDEVGEYLREHLIPVLRYADHLKEEVSHSVEDFDRVMRWGFGWEMGPFEMIDAIGADAVGLDGGPFYRGAEMRSFAGVWVPKPDEAEFRPLSSYPVVDAKETFALRDLGDGAFALALTTKMGVISPKCVEEMTAYLSGAIPEALVLTSEGRSFSAGFDLNFFADAIAREDLAAIDDALKALQSLGELLEQKNVVAAIFGHCLGAGLELALSCRSIVAHPETSIGLPETKVGLLPGGRGTTLVRLNNQHSLKRLAEVALIVSQGEVSTNADHARALGYLRPGDLTSYHPDRVLIGAKRMALHGGSTARPEWKTPDGPLGGIIDRGQSELKASGKFSDYDEVLADRIKTIFAKSTGYADALVRERQEFLDLCGRALSQARLRHMVETNRPLRN